MFSWISYGSSSNYKENTNAGFPVSLVKKAVFSGTTTNDGAKTLLLDGQNNPGFTEDQFYLKIN
ncbi:hypothetical protein VP395_01710 [Mariniflexile soesokkakense]|uniref:Uncharacterized protein n=2 Tax=Mariniflexile soesokkakense TaxID=1343160 RepID=A0ABV0A6B3_9FLAO